VYLTSPQLILWYDHNDAQPSKYGTNKDEGHALNESGTRQECVRLGSWQTHSDAQSEALLSPHTSRQLRVAGYLFEGEEGPVYSLCTVKIFLAVQNISLLKSYTVHWYINTNFSAKRAASIFRVGQ
jgi:hypothetical protein